MAGARDAPSLELHERITFSQLRDRCPSAWDEELGQLVFREIDCKGARFVGPVDFAGASFGSATFTGATFTGPVSFASACFRGDARFDSVTFGGTASFKDAHFSGAAIFEHLEGEEEVPEWPEEVTFNRWADFRYAFFGGMAHFGGARFESRARFDAAIFNGSAGFTGATFTSARTIGPIYVDDELDLDRVAFQAPVRLSIDAELISCRGTQFQSIATIELLRGAIALQEAAFAESSTISGQLTEIRPRVLSLQGADVAHLTLADLDLRECSFVSVHNLDGLRFEGAIDFCARDMLFDAREAIADEVEFYKREAQEADVEEKRVRADRIARAYRALRKGREDSKDAPGAADFYYGEMEMRRKAARRFDQGLLFVYWLTSGYALLAWRALAALAVTVIVMGVLLEWVGFDPRPGLWNSLLFSAESTTSLFRAPSPRNDGELNYLGHVLQMFLRLLGPLFFGLALLALRGRVKR